MTNSPTNKHRQPGLRMKAAALAVATTMAMTPMSAHAVYAQMGSVQAYHMALNNDLVAYNENLFTMIMHIGDVIQEATTAVVAALDKRSGVQQQLQQSELNYDAALFLAQRAAEAEDRYRAPSAEPVDACATSAVATSANAAANAARLNGKALSRAFTRKVMGTVNSSAAAQAAMDEYNANYCTLDDQRRGRCNNVAPPHLQGANLAAGTLLSPNGSETYTPQELEAAKSYINMVTNPVPAEALPVAVERTPGGQRYFLEQMQAQAYMSGATHSLSQIAANHTANSTFSGAGAQPGENISIAGLMRRFVEKKFGSQDYVVQLQGKDNKGLLAEIVISMAARNWMDYHTYLQTERTEANLALQLALLARERGDNQLSAARQAANQANRN